MVKWHSTIADRIRSLHQQSKNTTANDEAALLAGIQGGVGITLATGDMSYLDAVLDEGIAALRGS